MINIKKFFKSYKTIIYISFTINVILLVFSYYVTSNNKIYSFSGNGEYVDISDGIIVLNTDINLINGSSIKYINNEDYDISDYKIGYYTMKDKKLIEIVSTTNELETTIKLSEIINNFTSFNIVEKNTSKIYFTNYKKKLLDKELYFVIEAKTKDDNTIYDRIKLNISKISRY